MGGGQLGKGGGRVVRTLHGLPGPHHGRFGIGQQPSFPHQRVPEDRGHALGLGQQRIRRDGGEEAVPKQAEQLAVQPQVKQVGRVARADGLDRVAGAEVPGFGTAGDDHAGVRLLEAVVQIPLQRGQAANGQQASGFLFPVQRDQADAVHARRHIPVSDHAPEADRRGQSAGADGLPVRAVPAGERAVHHGIERAALLGPADAAQVRGSAQRLLYLAGGCVKDDGLAAAVRAPNPQQQAPLVRREARIALKAQVLRAAVRNVRADKAHRVAGRVAADEVQRPLLPEERPHALRQRAKGRARVVQHRHEVLPGPAPEPLRLGVHQ